MSTMKLDPKYDHYDYPHECKDAAPGHAGNLTDIQQAQVDMLRMMLEAEKYEKRLDTLTLLRFLRARKWNVDKGTDNAKAMFIACEKWRKEVDLDAKVPTWVFPKKDLFKFYPQFYHKTDKDGRPVYIEQLGRIDLSAMAQVTKKGGMTDEEAKQHLSRLLLDNLAVEYERFASPRLESCSRQAGYLVDTCCSIIDVGGVALSNASQVYSHVAQASTISNNYYPERLGKLYIINAHWTFQAIWRFVKGYIDPVSVAKIEILGTNYLETLKKQIPVENLPKMFGGACDCPDGGCMYSDAGPWKDPQYTRPAWWQLEAAKGEAAKEGEPTEEVEVKADGAALAGGALATEDTPGGAAAPAPA